MVPDWLRGCELIKERSNLPGLIRFRRVQAVIQQQGNLTGSFYNLYKLISRKKIRGVTIAALQ